MPPIDDLLHALWRAVEGAAAMEQELRATAELAARRNVAQPGQLDVQIAAVADALQTVTASIRRLTEEKERC